jgi:hypothetical protein
VAPRWPTASSATPSWKRDALSVTTAPRRTPTPWDSAGSPALPTAGGRTRGRPGCRVEAVDPLQGAEEGVLHQVVGVVRVSHGPPRDAARPTHVAAHQLVEGLRLAGLHPRDQLPLGGGIGQPRFRVADCYLMCDAVSCALRASDPGWSSPNSTRGPSGRWGRRQHEALAAHVTPGRQGCTFMLVCSSSPRRPAASPTEPRVRPRPAPPRGPPAPRRSAWT